MQIILLRDVPTLGTEGEIVTVKSGYGRNFLIPRGWALLATEGAVRARKDQLKQQARKRAQERDDAQELVRQLEGIEIEVPVKVGEGNRIFGTVTTQQVARNLALQGFVIDRRDITLSEEIRLTGEYTATVKLHSDFSAEVKIVVVEE